MKTYSVLFLSLLFLPVFAFADSSDFVANGRVTISAVTFGESTADMFIFSGSTAQSWTLSSGTFTVVNPGIDFQVGSSDTAVKTIKVNQSGTLVVCGLNTGPGTTSISLPDSSATYTIIPSADTTCAAIASTVSEGGGSGGGASVSSLTPQSSAATPTPVAVVPSSPVAQIVSPVFNKTLKYGITSGDVRRLQQLLAQDPEVYPEGIVSGWFGTLTKTAVKRFQCKHNIVCSGNENATGYGLVGPKTRLKLTEVFSKSSTESSGVTNTTTSNNTNSTTDTTKATEEIQKKIQELFEKVKTLQAQLKSAQ